MFTDSSVYWPVDIEHCICRTTKKSRHYRRLTAMDL